jgi:hypothetical protein
MPEKNSTHSPFSGYSLSINLMFQPLASTRASFRPSSRQDFHMWKWDYPQQPGLQEHWEGQWHYCPGWRRTENKGFTAMWLQAPFGTARGSKAHWDLSFWNTSPRVFTLTKGHWEVLAVCSIEFASQWLRHGDCITFFGKKWGPMMASISNPSGREDTKKVTLVTLTEEYWHFPDVLFLWLMTELLSHW